MVQDSKAQTSRSAPERARHKFNVLLTIGSGGQAAPIEGRAARDGFLDAWLVHGYVIEHRDGCGIRFVFHYEISRDRYSARFEIE